MCFSRENEGRIIIDTPMKQYLPFARLNRGDITSLFISHVAHHNHAYSLPKQYMSQ